MLGVRTIREGVLIEESALTEVVRYIQRSLEKSIVIEYIKKQLWFGPGHRLFAREMQHILQ